MKQLKLELDKQIMKRIQNLASLSDSTTDEFLESLEKKAINSSYRSQKNINKVYITLFIKEIKETDSYISVKGRVYNYSFLDKESKNVDYYIDQTLIIRGKKIREVFKKYYLKRKAITVEGTLQQSAINVNNIIFDNYSKEKKEYKSPLETTLEILKLEPKEVRQLLTS